MTTPMVVRVAGALVEAAPLPGVALHELVRVGERGLLGEVIRVDPPHAVVQVFEETSGLRLGEPVVAAGGALEIELGPGLLGSVLDGLGRPLSRLAAALGDGLVPGGTAPTLDEARCWAFEPALGPGDIVGPGDVLGTVNEPSGFVHRILVPPGRRGCLARLDRGPATVRQPIGALDDGTPLHLSHRWPVRTPRPVRGRAAADRPFVTGQRVFDLLFPVAEGGTVAVPGGFGTGKTIIEQSLAKFADADVVVYVGCGERGNEMAEVLTEFPALVDPRTGRSIMERSVLVVNTSNMPVAARESSVPLGLTVAEYFRDQGLRVALMADSLSRWAEALREIGSLLREMPGEEGYPTTLGSRLGHLMERAGRVEALGMPARHGALTMISALSPPGGDFAEPVTQAAMRVVAGVWALDPALAHQRQYPAVDWATSYTLQAETVGAWYDAQGGAGWLALREALLELLQRGHELREVASLVGPEALEDRDRVVLDFARLAREMVLGQSAFDPVDATCPPPKTHALASLVVAWYRAAAVVAERGEGPGGLDLAGVRRALEAVRQAPPGALPQAVAACEAAIGALA